MLKLQILAVFHEEIDPADWADEFREENEMGPDDDIDEEELKAFAIESFCTSIDEGDHGLEDPIFQSVTERVL